MYANRWVQKESEMGVNQKMYLHFLTISFFWVFPLYFTKQEKTRRTVENSYFITTSTSIILCRHGNNNPLPPTKKIYLPSYICNNLHLLYKDILFGCFLIKRS